MGQVHEAPRTHVQSEILASRTGFKIVRVKLPPEETLPLHRANGEVAIIVAAGEGRIRVGSREYPAEPGTVIEVPPNVEHSIESDEGLDLVLVQER